MMIRSLIFALFSLSTVGPAVASTVTAVAAEPFEPEVINGCGIEIGLGIPAEPLFRALICAMPI